MRIIKAGATSQSIYVEILDSTSTTGGRKTGLVYNSAGLTAYYALVGASAVQITLATLAAANSAWSSGGFKEVDATNMPGVYRLDVPNAALASGPGVVITLKGATGMVQVSVEIQLVAIDLQDVVRLGLTALPNAAAEAAGGLYTRGSGAGQINQPANGQIDANAVKLGGTTQTGRDIGASVLLSSGTGTGQLDFTSGVVKANLVQILGTALTETAGQIAAAFKQFFDVASPTGTMKAITNVVTTTNVTTVNGLAANVITAASVATGAIDADALAADAVTEIWAGSTAPTAAAIADAVLDEDMTAHQTQGTLGQAIGDPAADTNTIYKAVVTDAAGANIAADIIAIKAVDDAILVDTGTTLDAALAVVDGNVDTILADTNDIQTRLPAALTAGGNMKADMVALNGGAQSAADLKDFADDGYDPATNKVQGVVLVDTTTTLTNAPSDSSGVTTLLSRLSAVRAGYLDNLSAGAVALEASVQSVLSKLLKYVQLILRKDAAIATDNATEVTAINANGGSGGGAFANTTDSQEALRDRGDAAWITATGFSTLSQADVRTAIGLASANLDTQLDALPTAAENADAVWDEALADHLGAGSTGEALNAAGAAGDPWSTALPGAYGAGTAGKIIGENLNATVSSRASQISVDDLPTNAELATTLAAADDAILAAIAALNDLSAAEVTAAVPTAVQNADALLKRDWNSVSGEATRSALNALRFVRNRFSTVVTPGSVTVYKEDDTTVAFTKSLTTDAAAEPIVEG